MRIDSGRRMAAAVAASLLLGCGGGSSSSDGSYPFPPRGTITRETGGAWEALEGDGVPTGCRLVDNRWNEVHAAPGAHAQRMFVETIGEARAFGWQWRWPPSTDVVAYPELVCGTKPWDTEVAYTLGGAFPFQVGTARLDVDFDLALQASGVHNTAFSLWAVSDTEQPKATITNEIMIWVDNAGMMPAGTRKSSIVASDVTFDVYVMPNQTDHSGSTDAIWTYAAFVARQPMSSGHLDVEVFLDELERLGALPADAWIGDLELGNEIVGGGGVMEVTGFAWTVTPLG